MTTYWTTDAPDQTVWWNRPAVATAVLAKLRLQSSDVDAASIEALVDVAGEMINDYLDRVHPDPASSLARDNALVELTAELYGNDVPTFINGVRVAQPPGVDPGAVASIMAALRPQKQRFGVA